MAVLSEDPQLEIIVGGVDDLERIVVQALPSVVILDEAGERSEAVRISSLSSTIGIVVLAREPTSCYGVLLLAAGLTCLPWSASAKDILGAVRLTAQGGCIFVAVSGEIATRRDRCEGRILTRRKIEVLELVSQGESPAAIALELGIGVETVRTHIAHLRRKLKVSRTRELVGVQIPPALMVR